MGSFPIVYQYDSNGFYTGETEDYGDGITLPNNTTRIVPTIQQGYCPMWNGRGWVLVESHIGEEGFINGFPITISEHGPLPYGFSKERVASEKGKNENRHTEIVLRLCEIDRLSVRPIRAILTGTEAKEDKERLGELGKERKVLVEELKTL